MTKAEYAYLDNDLSDIPFEVFYDAGHDCYAEGWIDDFGIVTPKGHKAMEEYVERQSRRTL